MKQTFPIWDPSGSSADAVFVPHCLQKAIVPVGIEAYLSSRMRRSDGSDT